MQVDFYGLKLDAAQVTCYLWTPWRASALEHRLFDVVRAVPGVALEQEPDQLRAQIDNPKARRHALTAISRVLMGWQEEAADDHRERRGWHGCWKATPTRTATITPASRSACGRTCGSRSSAAAPKRRTRVRISICTASACAFWPAK